MGLFVAFANMQLHSSDQPFALICSPEHLGRVRHDRRQPAKSGLRVSTRLVAIQGGSIPLAVACATSACAVERARIAITLVVLSIVDSRASELIGMSLLAATFTAHQRSESKVHKYPPASPVMASASGWFVSAQSDLLDRLDLARPPGFVDPWLQRAVHAQNREPAFAWNRLHPVAFHALWRFGGEVHIIRAVGIFLDTGVLAANRREGPVGLQQ